MSDIESLKSQLWEGRHTSILKNKSEAWKMKDLEKVLKGLKYNQTRVPHELINEVFKPPVT